VRSDALDARGLVCAKGLGHGSVSLPVSRRTLRCVPLARRCQPGARGDAIAAQGRIVPDAFPTGVSATAREIRSPRARPNVRIRDRSIRVDRSRSAISSTHATREDPRASPRRVDVSTKSRESP
jgi:hypothetical protein